jgi:hypothetical protein
MVWFILAGICLYILIVFISWGYTHDCDLSIDKDDIVDMLKLSLAVWFGIAAGVLIIVFLIAGVFQLFPSLME